MKLEKSVLIEQLTPILKKSGYKKRNTTWALKRNKVTVVLNIQGSQWSKEDYYINLGVSLNELNGTHFPPYINAICGKG